MLGVCVVDSWLLHSGARGAASLKYSEFYEDLAADLIDNSFDSVGWRPRGGAEAGEGGGGGAKAGKAALEPAYGVGVHLKSTTKRRLDRSGGATPHLRQRYCRECKAFRSTLVCSACRDPTAGGESFCVGLRQAVASLRTTCGQLTTHFCNCFDGYYAGAGGMALGGDGSGWVVAGGGRGGWGGGPRGFINRPGW